MQKIQELKIGRYLVKVGKFPDGFRFNIFNHDKSLFGKGVEATEENAVKAAQALISTHNLNQQANRVNGIPTAMEFADALTAIKPSDAHWDMLKAHYNAPGKKLTWRNSPQSRAMNTSLLPICNMGFLVTNYLII